MATRSDSPPISDLDPIAASLTDLRDALGLTTPDLAALAGVDRSHLWRILTGKRPPTPEIVAAVLVALGHEVNRRAAEAA